MFYVKNKHYRRILNLQTLQVCIHFLQKFAAMVYIKRMRHAWQFFFEGIRSTSVKFSVGRFLIFILGGPLEPKSLSLKRYIAFEWLFETWNKRQRLQNYFKNILPTLSYGEAASKHPDKRKLNFDHFYPKYKRLLSTQTLFLWAFSIEQLLKKLKEIAFEWRATFYILSKNDQNSISFYQDVWKQLLHSWVLVECF